MSSKTAPDLRDFLEARTASPVGFSLANRLDAYPRAVDFLDEVLEVR